MIEEKADDPQNLVAKKEGTVGVLSHRNGIRRCPFGDMSLGDILVKGEIPLVNDSGETYDYSYVHADADIDLETTWYYYDTFPLSHTVRTYFPESRKKTPVFQISAYRFFLGNLLPENFVESLRSMTGTADQKTEKRENGADEEVSLQQLYLTENFALPFYFGYRQKFPFEVQKKLTQNTQAKEKASQNYQKFHRNLSEKGLPNIGESCYNRT